MRKWNGPGDARMPGREHLRGDQTFAVSRWQDQKQAADQMFSRPWSASQRSQLPQELPPAVQSLYLLPLLPWSLANFLLRV